MSDMDASLNEYKAQLKVVCDALVGASDEQKRELLELKANLEEVIDLTEKSIACDNQQSASTVSTTMEGDETKVDDDEEFLKFKQEMAALDALGKPDQTVTSTLDSSSNKDASDTDLTELVQQFEGSKVKIPFCYSWGEVLYTNAIVHGVESREISSVEDIRFLVMFLNPSSESMRPCNYFLDGHCRFPASRCRFSHGHSVSMLDIRDYEDPDFSNVTIGSRVFIKNDVDQLWHIGIVEDILNNEFNVKLTQKGEYMAATLDQILPIEPCSISSELSRFKSNVESEGSSLSSDEEFGDETTVAPAWNSRSLGSLGDWEKYTRGIGSQLMAKMGYVWGQGLGKEGEGRTEPVEATLYPQGKSLDQCMTLRTTGKLLTVRKKQMKDAKQIEAANKKAYHSKTVFDFLNKRVFDAKASSSSAAAGPSNHHLSSTVKLKKSTDKSLHVESFKNSEALKQAERDMARLKSSLSRNSAHASAVSAQIKQKIEKQQILINQLKANEGRISKEQDMRKSNRKLTIF